MTATVDPATARWYGRKFEDIDRELAALSAICRVDLLDPSVLERVLRNDASVCDGANPAAFGKMRDLLMMHYAVRTQAAQTLGEAPTQALIEEVVERIRARLSAS